MKKMLCFLIDGVSFFICIFALVSCGGGDNPDLSAAQKISQLQKVSSQKFEIIQNSSLVYGDGKVSGQGVLRFVGDLGDHNSAHHFALTLGLNDGESVTLVAFANAELEKGVEIRFARNGQVLEVSIEASGRRKNWTSYFADVDASSIVRMGIDIHNDHGPWAHVIFWDDKSGKLIFNSGRTLNSAPGKGLGQQWGLRLDNGSVLKIEKGEPRDAH